MNKQSRITFGPGAASIILIVVILSMSILGILSFMSARGDLAFSTRSVEVVQAVYAVQNQAERSFGKLDGIAAACVAKAADQTAYLTDLEAALPEEMTLEDDLILWEESDGVRTIYCEVRVNPLGEETRLAWVSHSLVSEIDGDSFW